MKRTKLLGIIIFIMSITTVFSVMELKDIKANGTTEQIENATEYETESDFQEETTLAEEETTSNQAMVPNNNIVVGVANNLKIVPTKNSIKIYWEKALNATSYNVLRSNTKNGTYQIISTNNSNCYFYDKNVKKGTTYYYKIQSLNNNTSKTAFSGRKSGKIISSFKIKLKKKKGVNYITWEKVSGAKGYKIMISSKKKGKYTTLKSVSKNKYVSYKLIKKGKKYYKVVPYYIVNGRKVYGQESSPKKINITRVKLSVKFINQYPNLPTGCEATALTMALNYHGFKVKKETIAKKYMKKASVPGDFYNYFLGNPFSDSGLGIYAPGLKKTANRYLKTKDTELRAYDITGASIDKICSYVATGHPVCIWTTYSLYKDPIVTASWTINGKKYNWKMNEHCMTVIGFDKKKDTLIIADPARGIMEYSRDVINKRNKQYNRMAVVIK